jgi:hypothetical protein
MGFVSSSFRSCAFLRLIEEFQVEGGAAASASELMEHHLQYRLC